MTMRSFQMLKMRLRSLFGRASMEAATRREMEMHLEMLTSEKIAEGLTPSEARAAALREMGNFSLLEEQSRDVRRVRYLHDLSDDLSFALRMLRKSPVFTLVSVLSLGLGIGANTAIFTLIKRTYLEMLPVRNPEQIVRVVRSNISMPQGSSFSYPLYRELMQAHAPLEGLICTSGARPSLVAPDGTSEAAQALLVSGNYFQLLGVQPLLGRLFTPDDDRHAGAHPVIVLSHNYWRKRFASDQSIVGKTVRVNITPMTVIGVSPPGFDGLTPGRSSDAMIPVAMQSETLQMRNVLNEIGDNWLGVTGRLKEGATAQQVEQALQPIMTAHFRERANSPNASPYMRSVFGSNRVHIQPMATGWHRSPASATNSMALLGITALVLLAACVNLANLLLARASARRSEMAVRLALGAGRFRLIRQLLTESLVLATIGGALGLALAVAAGPLVLRLSVGDDPQITQSSSPDTTVLLFCFGIATVCGLLFGMAPAWQAARSELNRNFAASRTVAGTRLIGRKLLLSTQIALTLLLLSGAALFVRTLRNMQTADLGLAPEQLLQFSVLAKNAGYEDKQVLPYLDRIRTRLQSVPGVRAVSLAAQPVLSNSSWGSGIRIDGVTIAENDRGPDRNAVGPDYFATLGIPLVLGRDFNERDSDNAPKVAIVNEAFARFYFGNENPIGRRIDQGGATEPARYTIVGVAKDGKYRNVRDKPTRFWYVPLAQTEMRSYITIYVRTSGDAEKMIGDVRRAAAAIDAKVAISNIRSLESQVSTLQRFERMIAFLAAFLGLLAVVLAAIGLYGVLSYLVNQRQREIGIRLALGASRASVAQLVLSSVAGWAALGIVLALPAIYYGSHAVQDILYEVKPLDPTALLAAAATLVAVAVFAAWLPARRAARVEPSAALRTD